MNFKGTITSIPVYNDGVFELFEIKQTKSVYPRDYLKPMNKSIWYEELSITDKLRFSANDREIDLTMKIRIPQTKQINSLNVLKINNEYHRVFNAYHFINQDGFPQTDLTLTRYKGDINAEN